MVQFCCGVGDCTAAGAQQSGKRSGSGSGGLYLKYANGTIIQPKQDAPMLLDAPAAKLQRSSRPASLVARSACTEDSWVADPDEDDYTRPADSSQVIFTGIAGGQMVMLMHERSASYTQSLSTSLGFADILSLGVEFSSSMTEETSDSTTRSFQAPPGQSGNVVFTAILRCSTGKLLVTTFTRDASSNSAFHQVRVRVTTARSMAKFARGRRMITVRSLGLTQSLSRIET